MAVSAQKKKKKWYAIYAPGLFNEQVIGESLTSEPSSLIGKRVGLNLMNLTNDPKKQNFRIIFKIIKVDGEKVFTDIIGYEMLLTHVKRIMRKGIEKVEDSFIVQSKDNVNMQIKPLLLARNKTRHSVLTAIRKTTREFLAEEAKKQDYNELVQCIIINKIQKQLRDKVNKIYPLVACEFRIVKKI